MVLTVAVIGAGASGLAAVKCCLDEGLEPTCFERTDYIGGLWHYTEKVQQGYTTSMKNTIANASKEVTAYSDFPPPPKYSAYMHNTELEEYLNLYADNFDLRKHIQLNTEVVCIYETEDHKATGRWNVKIKDVTTGNTDFRVFDAVLLCTGVFSRPIIPEYPGMKEYKGRVVHTQQYKDARGFEDKHVLVVGIGNSAADAACDISDVTRKVYLSTRNGSWIVTRLSKNGHPLDMALFSRLTYSLVVLFPSLINKIFMKQCQNRIDHYRYGLNPKYIPSKSNTTVNDQLAYKLLIGAIKMKPEIKRFCDNDVEFVDGTRIENVDVVVYGTGYLPEFPFLDDNVIGKDKTQLYLAMFPPEREKHTLATIGCFRIKGPVVPLVEMQARLATRVLKGHVTLPDRATMYESIQKNKRESIEKRHYSQQSVIQVDYFPYMDQLATMIGCKPNFWKMLFTDRALAKQCVFGPGTSYQYRLVGPGRWNGARDAILTQWDRTYFPVTGGKRNSTSPRKSNMFILAFALAVTSLAVYLCLS